MKKLFIAGLFILGLFAAAMAGDYHFGNTLICSDCHVMHHSQAHGYNADGGGISPFLGADAEPYLLRDEVNRLCLSCHDGSGTGPDVYGVNSRTYTRQAGALNKATDAGPYYPADGHTLYSKTTAPGGNWAPDTSEGLACVNCHHQHGSAGSAHPDPAKGQYRNLRRNPGGISTNNYVTYAIGENDPTKDVFERYTAPLLSHYSDANIDFNEPDQTKSAYGAWCQSCHTSFHGSSTDANMRDQGHDVGEGWLRHPTADINIGTLTGGHSSLSTFRNHLYRVKVMSSGGWGTQGAAWTDSPTNITPSCFSCHKGHGNKNPFGLIYAEGNGPLGEEGDGDGADYQAKTLCKQCHVQGAYATVPPPPP